MYQILLTSLLAGLSAQLAKPLFNREIKGRHSLYAYAGMPSAHAAFAASLTAMVGLKQGADSALFAVCFIFSLLTLRDALGLRRDVGRQAEVLNQLSNPSGLERLDERVGHTPGQVAAGTAWGIAVSLLSYFIFH